MKQIYKIVLSSVVGIASFVPTVFALDPEATRGVVSGKISTLDSILPVANNIMLWILAIAFSFAVFMLILGGFRYITSAGNEAQAEGAKETITKAIIGLVIILLAFVIVSTINAILSGPELLTNPI